MRHLKLAMTVMAAAVIAGCGGGDPRPGDQTPKNKYSAEVIFGDSLVDVGTYKVGAVAALGGGLFTINGDNTAVNPVLTGKIFPELIAAQLGLPKPCAAVTGLEGDPALGFSVPVQAHTGCYGYGQGGSRVSNPIGEGNKATGSKLGALTYPFTTQVQNHLAAVGGKFKGDEIVFVVTGNNDLLIGMHQLGDAATAAGTAAGKTAFANSLIAQLAAGATNPATAAQSIGIAMATEAARPGSTDATIVGAAVTAAVMAGNSTAGSPAVYGPMVAKAQADATAAGTKAGADYFAANAPLLVQSIATAAGEIVATVKNQMIANGANYVTVVGMPDVATTPAGRATTDAARTVINAAVKAFNDTLSSGLGSESKVLLIDAYTLTHDQATNPGIYGLTNSVDAACDFDPAKNPFGNSLGCTANNLKAGDVSHYAFADSVHPTPYMGLQAARYISERLIAKGWM